MMNLNKLFVLLLVSAGMCATAQDFRLGKVSKEELLQKIHPIDTSATAAYLFKKGKTNFELTDGKFFMVTEVDCRIKIYKKDGYEYANDELSYYTGGRSIRVDFSDAYTYNLVGDKIEKTKLKSDGEFEEKINEDYSVKKITMPNVKEGSVIEYRYVVRTPYFWVFPDWHFQHEIPTDHISYEVAIPSYFIFNRYMTGYIPINRSEPKAKMAVIGGFPEVAVMYIADDVPALKNESHVNNIENYLSILKHELASVQFPGQPLEKYSTDWASVAQKIYEDDDFGREINYTSYYEKDINALLTPGMLPAEKAEVIFTYVKGRMNWDERFGYYCVDGVKKAYESKVGNIGEINLMLTSMLRYAKLDANPVLISTRANGVALFPTRTAYNYVVAGVKINDELLLLDASSKNALPNVMPIRTINWEGRMIMSNGKTAQVDLMPKKNSREIVNIAASIDGDGRVTGKVRDQYFDHYAYSFRENYAGTNKDSYIEKLEKRYSGLEIGEYAVANDKELAKPVVEDFDFAHNSLADVIGNKIYINPMLFFTMSDNPFKAETREYPMDFIFPHQDKYTVSLKLPEGYAVEALPAPLSLSIAENVGFFRYNIQSTGNQIQLVAQFDINQSNVPATYYPAIKEFYQKMIAKQSEKIVLVKKI